MGVVFSLGFGQKYRVAIFKGYPDFLIKRFKKIKNGLNYKVKAPKPKRHRERTEQ